MDIIEVKIIHVKSYDIAELNINDFKIMLYKFQSLYNLIMSPYLEKYNIQIIRAKTISSRDCHIQIKYNTPKSDDSDITALLSLSSDYDILWNYSNGTFTNNEISSFTKDSYESYIDKYFCEIEELYEEQLDIIRKIKK